MTSIPSASQPLALDHFSQRIQFVDNKGYLTAPAQLFLQKIADFVGGANQVLPVSASTSSNAITLTYASTTHPQTKYTDYSIYGFIADNAGTSVTANVGGLGALPVYEADGTTRADTTQGTFYLLIYSDAVNSGNGGFILK